MQNPSDVFRGLCEARALLWALGYTALDHAGDEWLGHAIDPLDGYARRLGLTPDEAQPIIAAAFEEARTLFADCFVGGDDDDL